MKKNRSIQAKPFLTIVLLALLLFLGCEKKVPAPNVETQNPTSSTTGSSTGGTTGGSTTGGSTTGGSTTGGSTTGGTSTTGGSTTGGSTSKTITFWSDFSGPPIEITVNGTYRGSITQYYQDPPNCFTSGCVSVTFNSSSSVNITWAANDGNRTWSGSETLVSACTTMNLTD
jgi:hypothetical protein